MSYKLKEQEKEADAAVGNNLKDKSPCNDQREYEQYFIFLQQRIESGKQAEDVIQNLGARIRAPAHYTYMIQYQKWTYTPVKNFFLSVFACILLMTMPWKLQNTTLLKILLF